MGKHCLSILREFLQEYTPLVRLCFDTCMQERHQQKDFLLEWELERKMQHDKMFREQIRLFRRGRPSPVLAEFEQAIGGRKLFVVQDAENALVVCGFHGEVLEGFDHLFDRVDTKMQVFVRKDGETTYFYKEASAMGSILERAFGLWEERQIVGCTLQVSKILARYAALCLERIPIRLVLVFY